MVMIALFGGFLLDLAVGDPEWMPHPIRLIGKLIDALEKGLRRDGDSPKTQRAKGILFTILVLMVTGLVTFGLVKVCDRLHPVVGLVCRVILSAYVLASKSMAKAALSVWRPLSQGNVEEARRAVSMIVGRDTAVLDDKGITRAAIESVAESTSDGVIAPLFYLAIGGPVLAMMYKAANTMDSMVGYKNERYRYFGTASAICDDIVNYIPARLSAVFMILASYVLGLDGRHAAFIHKRDHANHASPNSAQTESVCAGALHIRLAGDAVYFGKVVEKPYIGDDDRPVEIEDIRRANRLMYMTAVVSVVAFGLVRGVVLLML